MEKVMKIYDHDKYVAELKKWLKKETVTKEKAHELLFRTGIVTPTGRLKKQYK